MPLQERVYDYLMLPSSHQGVCLILEYWEAYCSQISKPHSSVLVLSVIGGFFVVHLLIPWSPSVIGSVTACGKKEYYTLAP